MFYVRITPQHIASGATPPRDISTHTHASRAAPPHRAMPRPTERNGIQPASRVERVERDYHGVDVRRALRRLSPPPAPHAATSAPRSTSDTTREPSRASLTGPCFVRQHSNAFNQPLAWDITRVTTMVSMFQVRYTPRPTPPPAPHAATCNLRHHVRAKLRLSTEPCRPAVCNGIQPVARMGYLERDHHGFDVPSAQRATLCTSPPRHAAACHPPPSVGQAAPHSPGHASSGRAQAHSTSRLR